MEGSRQGRQNLRQIIKNDIQQDQAGDKMAPAKDPLEAGKYLRGRLAPFTEAGGTEHLILMFGDTLPAEKPSALRTAGHCLAEPMIQAALVSEILHNYLENLLFA